MPGWILWLVIGETSAPATKAVGVVSYTAATALCAWAMQRRTGGERRLWVGFTVLGLMLLGNIRWDWAAMLSTAVRASALGGNWYVQRNAILPWVLAAALGVLAVAFIGMVIVAQIMRWQILLALIGSTGSMAVQTVQAVSLHQTDQMLYAMVGPVMLVAWLWAGCAACTSVGALKALYGKRAMRSVYEKDSREERTA